MKRFAQELLFLSLFCSQILLSGGKTSFKFLTIGVDAKVVSLADAGVAIFPDIGTIYYNPAGLAYQDKNSFILTYRNWLIDGDFVYFSASIPTKNLNFAISLTSLSISDIEIRTMPGEIQGKFTSRDLSLAFSISPKWRSNLKTGLTIKYIFEKIFVDEIHFFALDLGVLYPFKISDFNFYTGVSLKDIGFSSKYRNSSINPPSTLSIGASVSYSVAQSSIEPLLLFEGKHKFYDRTNLFSTAIGFKFLSGFTINLGFTSGNNINKFRFGTGIETKNLAIQYAFAPNEFNFPTSHTLTIKFNF